MKLLVAAPRGFCAGVDRAIEIVEESLKKFGAPVYVRHEIVHNKHVVNGLVAKGAIFVEELDECPNDRPVIFSAHGVAKVIFQKAKEKLSIPAETQWLFAGLVSSITSNLAVWTIAIPLKI